MPTTLALNIRLNAGTTHHDTEVFDAETLALLDALDIDLPAITDVDLDVYYGTPLEMHEPAGTLREMRQYAAAILAAPVVQRYQLSCAHGNEIRARVDAARDIVATDPTIVPLVRERLAAALVRTAQLRTTRPVAVTLLAA
ncbi:hypothetical protein ACIGN6_31995 [Streptomyces sp. NPDC053792]|uniref:hypothetical protein n=1 Tax=Streptomyces sp. NPDC053792 TaxID=3365716 RepID=UPI0037CEF985